MYCQTHTGGFEFFSWQGNIFGDSTQMLQVSSPPAFLDSILDFLHLKPDIPEATLNMTKFTSFATNFNELPQPIPSEYIAILFAVCCCHFGFHWLLTILNLGQMEKISKSGNEIKILP